MKKEFIVNKALILESYFVGEYLGLELHTSGNIPKESGDLDVRKFISKNPFKISKNSEYSTLSENNVALLMWKIKSTDKGNLSTVIHTPLFKDFNNLKIKEILKTIHEDVMSMSSYYKGNHIFKFPKNSLNPQEAKFLRNTTVTQDSKYTILDIKN